MNLIQLKYFQAVCKYQSVSAAAEYLYISQPTLSSAIKELEREFGVSLFRRHHRGMVLTPEGTELLKHSDRLLTHADQVERIMSDFGKRRKVLRLGVPPMIGSLFLPDIYRNFVPLHPEIKLDITEGSRQEMQNQLSKELLDMVFLSHNAPFDTSIQSIKVASQETVCCVSKNSPLAKLKSVSPKDLAEVPIVLFKDSFFQTEEIKKLFSAALVKPNIILQTNQLSTLQNLIKSNIAAGFMFRDLIVHDPDLVAVPLDTPINISVSLAWKHGACFFSAMDTFLDYVRNKKA